jgi:pimeloyl-ACP methyl ester carboxylesterase
MNRRRRHTLTVLTALALSAVVIPAAAKDADVGTDEVCFTVHNEGDPLPSRVHGIRYYVGEPRPEDKVIVLVHGNSVTGAFWDLRPDLSVARNFAEAGYLVIAYDRLGYGKSPYMRPRGAGYTLTLSSQRAMLHEILTQVKSGSYTFSGGGTCGNGPVVGLASPTVIVIGHSAGGAIVSGYPGTYHDVAAAVPTGWNNRGFPPEAAAYLAKTWGPQYAKGDDYATLFPTEDGCRTTLLYEPGVAPSLLPDFCRNSFVPAPAGEIAGASKTVAENLAAITRVGPGIPVLLAFEDRDFFFPQDRNDAETQYWMEHCGCDVESWTQPDTGHALVAHSSMPSFTSKVVTWLTSRGLGAQ